MGGTGHFEGGELPITGGVEAVSEWTLAGDAQGELAWGRAETSDSRVSFQGCICSFQPWNSVVPEQKRAGGRILVITPKGQEGCGQLLAHTGNSKHFCCQIQLSLTWSIIRILAVYLNMLPNILCLNTCFQEKIPVYSFPKRKQWQILFSNSSRQFGILEVS